MSLNVGILKLTRAAGLAFLAATGLAACDAITAVQDDGSFHLQVGERARSDGDFEVRFLSVPYDGRCPIDVSYCNTQGDAVVRLELSTSYDVVTVDLHLDPYEGPDSFEMDGHVVELLDLSPWPYSGHYIAQRDYIARLRVSHF